MAFVISISGWVLKDGALNGGISVDLGRSAAAIKPRHSYLLLTRLFAFHHLPAGGETEVAAATRSLAKRRGGCCCHHAVVCVQMRENK